MAGFSFNIFPAKGSKQALARYERLPSPPISPSKERFSDNDDDDDDDDFTSDDETTDDDSEFTSTRVSSSSNSSRQTSGSHSSSSFMIPKRHGPPPGVRQSTRRYAYRIPNRIMRYMCFALITTLIVFILSLIRASQVENQKIATGQIEKPKSAPAAYENFEFLTRYYGGMKTLVSWENNEQQYPQEQDGQPFNITGDPQSSRVHMRPEDHKVNEGTLPPIKSFSQYDGSVFAMNATTFNPCFLDKDNAHSVPPIRYYDGRPSGMPENVLGSYELLGLPEDICFERFGRFGPYGFGYPVRRGGLGSGLHAEKEGSEAVWNEVREIDYSGMDWADAQRRCYRSNLERFGPATSRSEAAHGFYIDEQPVPVEQPGDGDDEPNVSEAEEIALHTANTTKLSRRSKEGVISMPRTALVIRCWDEYEWGADAIMNLRAMVAELSLASGGRYDIHLLVQVKNEAKYPIWADDAIYRKHLREAVPKEFRGMATLWSETQMLAMYQGLHDLYIKGAALPVHGVYRGLQLAMQHFANIHPEYNYFWQWEMDIRYTGHYYDLLSKIENWAREQPRKGIWERNARFYVPAVHGTWEDFKHQVRVQTEIGTTTADDIWKNFQGGRKNPHDAAKGEEAVWGPVRPLDAGDWFEHETDPVPPTTSDKDKYVWGAGEEADLITLNPIFDPEGTTWGLANDITGYNETGGRGKPPRRASVITASRMSRKLLLTMHRETALKKHHAFSEMWPATVALQHGYKGVFVPHPVYIDRAWPLRYLAATLNNGRNGASGGARMSVFGQREHNLRGLTWFYGSGFAPNLYRRWLGLKVNNDGGEEFEMRADMSRDDSGGVAGMRGGEGRMCLPPMLLHPIKDVELPVELNPHELPKDWEPEMDYDS